MFLVAVTGGIGTGKTTVCKVFLDNGIPVVDADKIAREGNENCVFLCRLFFFPIKIVCHSTE